MVNSRNILFLFFCLGLTLSCFGSRIYWPTDEVIKKSPIIIEGKVISVPPAYWSSRMIYTSYIVQVYKLFKGNLQREFIEIPMEGGWVGDEGVDIPSCGTLGILGKGQTGIFFLSDPPNYDPGKTISPSGDTIAKNFVIHLYYDCMGSGKDPWSQATIPANIEHDWYQYIEKLTGQKRKIISRPETDDIEVRKWLIQNNKPEFLKATGLSLNFVHSEIGRSNTFNLFVDVKSNVGFTDLNKLEFAIKYDPAAFGTFVVKNKNVEFNKPQIAHTWKWEGLSKIILSDSAYKKTIIDLDSTTILITISALDTSKGIFQIEKELIAFMCFKIKDMSSKAAFSFVPKKTKGKYYDYEHSKISSFKYIFCNNYTDVSVYTFLAPVVTDFYPDTLLCGTSEFFTIKGKNLQSEKTRVNIWSIQNGCSFNKFISNSQFLSQSDTSITINIPCELSIGNSDCGRILPAISGFTVDKEGLFVFSYSPRKFYIKH